MLVEGLNEKLQEIISRHDPNTVTLKLIIQELQENDDYNEEFIAQTKPIIKEKVTALILQALSQQQNTEESNISFEPASSASEKPLPSPEMSAKSKTHKPAKKKAEPDSKPTPEKKTKKEKSKPKETVEHASPKKMPSSSQAEFYEKKIEKLKDYIRKCGVKKIWSKEFAGMSDPKDMVKRLEDILHIDLGMKGTPSLQKCKEIKTKREYLEDIQGIDVSNILPSSKRSRRSEESQPTIIAVEREDEIDFSKFGDKDDNE